jgi:hypothetical protein
VHLPHRKNLIEALKGEYAKGYDNGMFPTLEPLLRLSLILEVLAVLARHAKSEGLVTNWMADKRAFELHSISNGNTSRRAVS